jgi:hypothetical protein
VRLRKVYSEGHPLINIDELGDSESILRNKAYLRETAQQLIRRGMVPQEEGWNGWLGRYQKAVAEAAIPPERPRPAKETGRDKRRDHGR